MHSIQFLSNSNEMSHIYVCVCVSVLCYPPVSSAFRKRYKMSEKLNALAQMHRSIESINFILYNQFNYIDLLRSCIFLTYMCETYVCACTIGISLVSVDYRPCLSSWLIIYVKCPAQMNILQLISIIKKFR